MRFSWHFWVDSATHYSGALNTIFWVAMMSAPSEMHLYCMMAVLTEAWNTAGPRQYFHVSDCAIANRDLSQNLT